MKRLQAKLAKYDEPQKAKAAGIYPYFRAISSEQDTEVLINGKKVLLIDDVFGQGGTTKGLKELVAKAGAEISAHAVIAIEQNTNHPRDLVYLFELPVID